MVLGGVVLERWAVVAGAPSGVAPRWGSGKGASREVGVEGEELLEVHHPGGESKLEQCFAFAAVAGFGESVHFEFGEFPFDEGSSSELASCRGSGLLGSCILESLLVEVEGEYPTVAIVSAAFAQCTVRAAVTEAQEPYGSAFLIAIPSRVGCGVSGRTRRAWRVGIDHKIGL